MHFRNPDLDIKWGLPSSEKSPVTHTKHGIRELPELKDSIGFNTSVGWIAQRFLMFWAPCKSSGFLYDLKRDGDGALILHL